MGDNYCKTYAYPGKCRDHTKYTHVINSYKTEKGESDPGFVTQ